MMENFSCSEGRPPDDGVPDVLMVDDVAGEEGTDPNATGEQCGVFEECVGIGAGDKSADHVDIETCDQPMAEMGEPVIKSETEPPFNSEQDEESELEEDKEPLSYDLAQGNRILTEIMSDANKSLNWPFMDPVDAEGMGLVDYHERVREPMWLKKIREKFDKRMYTTITEFARDFRLMLENCYRYNGPDHYVSKRGQKLDTVFEQKLGLLSRDLREKTSIAATSGKPIEDKIITGTRRRKVLTPHDSSDLLNKLRQEEKERERENRKAQVEERRQQQQAAVQELIDWEDNLLGPGGRDFLYSMWELPQIGHFLFLTADLLNTGEVMQWEIEHSFWMPRQSPVLQVIMTSLLSTPYQRTKLESKPPMPYKLWEDKLRTRVRNWYKIFNENSRDTTKTHLKIGLEEKFFKVVGMTSPLERQKFHELTFYQRVWIVKSLCDWCLATQESIREAIEAQPLTEQRHYDLGTDAEGNSYIHFPQFCGQDLRVYRIAPIEMPKTERPKVKREEKQKSPKKRKGATRRGRQTAPSPNTKQRQSSRLRAPSSHSESSGSSSDSGINDSEGSDLEAPIIKLRRKSPAPSSTSSKPSSASNTPTKGRSSRTSAAARDWMPRDTSLLSELTGRRGSRSQRLTCAPVDNSGTSTPTTIATPSGSRASTPVPTQEPSSRSSTPSLDASSRASSPSKLPAGSRKGRTKGLCKTNKPAAESVLSEDEETSMDIVDKTGSNDDNVNSSTREDLVTDSNTAPTIANQDGESKQGVSCVNGFLPGEEEDSRVGTPFSSYSAEDSLLCGVPGTSDSKTCDTESKPTCPEQPTHPVDPAACLTDNDNSRGETRVNGQCEGSTKTLSRGGSLKGSSFDGDHCENQFCLCKCDGIKEGSIDCPSLNKNKSDFEHKDTPNADGDHVNSDSNITQLTDDTVAMPNVGTSADPVPTIKTEPETDMPVIDNPGMYESQTDLNDVLMPELEPMSMEPIDIRPTPPELTDVKMEVSEQEVKQEPEEDVIADTGSNEKDTSGSVEPVIKQEEEEYQEPEIKYPEVGPFRLIADSVEMLKELTLQFAEPEPIIEIKGKKEKVLRPPPRKRCVSDLYDRLQYLLKELEPWESKLVAVNKKARIKLRKEVENYVEENEPEEVEDVWESEESQSEDSDENEDSEDEAGEEEEIVEELPKEVKKESVPSVTASPTKSLPKPAKKTIVLIPPPDTDASTSNDSTKFSNDMEKSSFGRVRKRKVIPNAYDEPPVNKKKKGREHSPSPTPNILASSRSKNKMATQEPNSIDTLRTALSKAKPVSAPSALPPGMQLLNIGGQNVLLNTNTNPPVILQTSAPLNLNNLTLLAQLSAKAAAGNSLSSKIVVNSTSSLKTPVATAKPTQATSVTSPAPQQVIRTLLAAGHAPQHPKARIIQQAVTPLTKSTPPTPISSVQQLQFVQSAVSTATSSVTTLASTLPPSSLGTQISGQSLLQHNSVAGDNTRPQFYKYNDMSQMKATIRQQLVKTSQGLRTKSAVCTVPTGNTALSNLIQAGLLPQSPRMTSSMVQPAATSEVTTTTPTGLTVPVKSHNSSESSIGAVSAPIAPTAVVASVEGKPPSILSQVLASTGPAGPQQTVVHTDIPTSTVQLQVKQEPQEEPQQQPATVPQLQTQQTPVQVPKVQQPQQIQQPQQQTQHIVVGTTTQNILQSPTSKNTESTVTILTSPQKSPVGTHILPKGQLSPEFKAAIKMGIVNESNIGSLIHANPGLAKALNNTMRPKYASNVTVKSLLESRALRQKAQLYGDGETSSMPSAASPPGASLTVSPQKPAASPIKVQGLNLPTPNDKPVAIQIHSVNPKPQVLQTPTSAMSPHLVISAKPQQVGKTKTLPLQVQSIKTEGQTQVPPSTVSKTPIQLQAVRTSQGTILRTLSGQQVTVRPGGARLQLGTGGQQMVRLVSPTGAVQLVDTSQTATPKQPAQPTTIASSSSTTTLTTLDEAVKSVITSVSCSIPPTPLSIARQVSSAGQQPIRQVTMTTNTMKSPIPSVTHEPAAETQAVATAVGQTAKVILSPNSTPGQVVSGSVGATSVSGAQKNVVLRVVPGQQQMMTSQGLISMVVPQQLLQQSLKADNGSGKLVLQGGKGGLQLTQVATAQSTASSPIKINTQPSPALTHPVIKQPTAQSNPRTITVFPPGRIPPQTQQATSNLDTKQTLLASSQSQAQPSEPRSHVQIKLVPQTSGVAQLPQSLATGAQQQLQPKANHTLVLKKDGSLSIGASPVGQTQTVLVNKAQLQQRQGLPRITSPVKHAVAAPSSIRTVSPQLTLSSAGLVPVGVTQARIQPSQTGQPATKGSVQAQPVSVKQEADVKPASFLLERDGMGEVTSSLDLLAAASMLQEAKAPLPSKVQPQVSTSTGDSIIPVDSSGGIIRDAQQVSPQSQQVTFQSPNVKQSEPSRVLVSHEPTVSQTQQSQKTTASTIPLNKFHQQQAMVLEQQIKLQQQMLEEQQKQQKLIRQLTLQQEVALGAPPTCKPQPQATVPAAAPSPLPVAKAQVTTTAKPARTVPDGATVQSSGTKTPAGTQMAGVMASAGGRMVQLRFAVPAGMNVQQLLQTSQFQQQLAALKVSAIHGITTSTVTATSTTQSTSSIASPGSSTVLTSQEQVAVSSHGGHVQRTVAPTTVHTRPVQMGSRPVQLVATMANNAVATVTTPSKPVPTGKTLTLPQGASTVVTGQQSGNKVTVLVNVNGQLVQAQGLSLGSNMRMVSSGGELSTARSAAPKLVATAGSLPVGTKVIQTVNNSMATHSSSQPRFLTTKATGHPMLTSPTKLVLQPRTITPQRGAAPHVLVTRTGDGSNTVRLPVGMTLQEAAKSNLLSQLVSAGATAGAAPGGLILTKPITGSTAPPQVSHTTLATVTPQNASIQNGK